MIRHLIIVLSLFQVVSTFAQNHDAELVNHETKILVKNGKLYKTQTYEIMIYNRAGDKYSNIKIPFSSLIKVSNIEAYIKDKNGKIVRKLKKSEIKERSAISDFSFYEDDFIKEFTLKHYSYPYSIFYTYQIQQEEFLFIDYWLPVIDSNTPTLNAILNVEIPEHFKIIFTNNLIHDFEVNTSDFQSKYTWKTSYKDVIEPEIFAPPIINFLPSVIIVPQEFKYDVSGFFYNWSTYGDWQYELLQELSELPQGEKDKILSLINEVDDEKEKIKKLYYYLQDETRYINITIETGGLKPFPASYVAINKYGDCKALTNYFKSVLDFIGIHSYYTNVLAGDPIKEIDKNFPSQQFNHVILCVPIKNETLWLDCTSDGPFNYLGTFTQNRDAFIIERNKSEFIRTPSMSCEDVLESRSIKFHMNQQDNVTTNFSNIYKGEKYETLYFISQSFSELEKLQLIKNNFVEKGFDASDLNVLVPHKDSAKIYLSYTAITDNVYNKYGDEILIDLFPFSIPHFEEPIDRKLPLQLDYPINKIDTLEYSIPEGYHVINTTIDRAILNEFGQYKVEFNLENNKIRVVKSLILNSGKYSIDKYVKFYEFISIINENENNTHILTTNQE